MEDGWKWKHINRGTILYKLLHKFDKLGEKGNFSMSQLQNKQQEMPKKRSEHWSQEVKKIKVHQPEMKNMIHNIQVEEMQQGQCVTTSFDEGRRVSISREGSSKNHI